MDEEAEHRSISGPGMIIRFSVPSCGMIQALANAADVAWAKSTASTANGNCVEIARLPGGQAAIRDSKDRLGPALLVTASQWRQFLGAIRDGQFDLNQA